MSCCKRGVQLYDVVAGGNRTSLTKTQIVDLFQAGQLDPNDPCKPVQAKGWRTIDALLNSDTSTKSLYQPTELYRPRAHVIALAAGISIFVISAGLLVGYFALRNGTNESGNAVNATAATNPRPPVTYTIENPYIRSRQDRAAQERLEAARKVREQAAQSARLAQDRAGAELRERELLKAAGRTERIPLDQFSVVPNVGGSEVRVKIHDNDVSSFDVWVNGTRRRQVPKQKATTGTDETLIYRNGRARLYYVSETGGKLTHGLLRVREE